MSFLLPNEIEGLRHNIPSELRTADWDKVPLWLRERSFFMASVTKAETLQEFRSMSAAILRGDVSEQKARRLLRDYLKRVGYRPLPKQEGTIKDLRSVRRMKVALRTNVRMMQGAAQWERYRGSRMFPAMQLVRIEQRIEKRDWRRRWSKAAAPYGAEVSVSRMIAPHGHPIWRDISRFGLPYPPYDFMSGMGQMPVRVDEAKQYIDLDAPFEQSEAESLNSMLAVSPRVNSKKLRAALSEHLKGYARWQGNKLVFTDPNGTSPIYGDYLAKVWEQGLPEGFENGQMKAFIEWVRDSSNYNTNWGKKSLRPYTNRWEDLLRLYRRIRNREQAPELWRGMKMSQSRLDKFLIDHIKKGVYGVRDTQPAESWTSNEASAWSYAKLRKKDGALRGEFEKSKDPKKRGGNWSVVLRVKQPKRAKDVTALVGQVNKLVGKEKNPSIVQDSEWLYGHGQKFEVIHITKNKQRRTMFIELKEVGK